MKEFDLINRLSRIFIARENLHGQTIVSNCEKINGQKVKGESLTKDGPALSISWEQHLSGEVGLGLSPILQNNKCKFAALDIDLYDINIIELSKKYNHLPLFFCRTKSGGCHVYLFFKRQFSAKEVRLMLDELSFLLKLPIKEIFPKQEDLKKDAKANWINIPYVGGDNTDRYCVYGDVNLTLKQFIEKVETKLIDDFHEDLLKHFLLAGAPYCLQKIYAQGIPQGLGDIFLFNTAIFLKQRFKVNWQDKVRQANREFFEEPIEESRIEKTIIKQVEKKDVFYQCATHLADYCQKKICKNRKYGVAIKNSPDLIITGLKKVDSNPPIWHLLVKDKTLKLSTEDLLNINVVRVKCMEALNELITKCKQEVWDEIIRGLQAEIEVIPAPKDADENSQLIEYIKEFCLKRSMAREIEDTERGHVFKQDGFNLFKGKSIVDYLKSKKYLIKTPVLWDMLREMGGKEHRKNNLRLWALPLFEEQSNIVETRKEVDWDAIKKEEDAKEAF